MKENDRSKTISRAYSLGFELEEEYGACSQMVLTTIQELFGTVDDKLIKASHALAGGGAGCEDGTCGALAGGLLAIGAEFGRGKGEFGGYNDELYKRLGKELHDRFSHTFGSCICGDVRNSTGGLVASISRGKNCDEKTVNDCPGVVGVTASWTAEILLDNGTRPVETLKRK